jgi:hypothetical protein
MMNLPSALATKTLSVFDRTRSTLRGATWRKAARWRRKCVQKEAGAAKRFGSGLFRFGTLVTY